MTRPRISLVARGDRVEVRRSPRHGLGVFAREALRRGTVIERCPVLLFGSDESPQAERGALSGYLYDWGDGVAAIALGYGSLYNHDFDPSATYAQGDDGRSLVLRARRSIAAGEEITIDYTDGGRIELWFAMSDGS